MKIFAIVFAFLSASVVYGSTENPFAYYAGAYRIVGCRCAVNGKIVKTNRCDMREIEIERYSEDGTVKAAINRIWPDRFEVSYLDDATENYEDGSSVEKFTTNHETRAIWKVTEILEGTYFHQQIDQMERVNGGYAFYESDVQEAGKDSYTSGCTFGLVRLP